MTGRTRRPSAPALLPLLWTVVALLLPALSHAATATAPARPPNIVFILADDLGYGDVGAYGQERIRTPNLDRLAAEGLRFTRHYSGSAVCAPSRCVLLTGRHPGHAQIRDNTEVQPEGQFPLEADTPTLPRLLQRLGYRTGAFGKWGLGPPGSPGDPLQQGFDRFYGYNCQRAAHNHYPDGLWDDRRRVALRNPSFPAHQRLPANADPTNPDTYAGYRGSDYAPDLIAAEAEAFLRREAGRPFFLYYATTLPHLALQVPGDSLAEYAGGFEDPPYDGSNAYLPHPSPRAAYAAMITRLDASIGRLMQVLRELGVDRNTLVVFTSDNGPLFDRLGGTDSAFFNSAGGLRGRKGSLHEGGVRVPCIVRWPGLRWTGVSDRVTGFEDWLPTLLELAGGRDLVPPDVDGISFVPTLLGRRQRERPFLYREFPGYGGWQAVWRGDWKLVRHRPRPGGGMQPPETVELFNLAEDPHEERNLAPDHPRRVRSMLDLARVQHARSARFPLPFER